MENNYYYKECVAPKYTFRINLSLVYCKFQTIIDWKFSIYVTLKFFPILGPKISRPIKS